MNTSNAITSINNNIMMKTTDINTSDITATNPNSTSKSNHNGNTSSSSNVKIAPVTPYHNNNSAAFRNQSSTVATSCNTNAADQILSSSSLSIASLSEKATLNDYHCSRNGVNRPESHYFFGGDLVRNADGTCIHYSYDSSSNLTPESYRVNLIHSIAFKCI